MFIAAVGINHRTAPVEVREKLAFGKTGLIPVLLEVKELPPVHGCVVLSTCNRTEIYAAVTQIKEGLKALGDYLQNKAQLTDREASRFFQSWTCYEAINHLFRVAAGLDSMILGETEILGQVREAYELACRLKVGNNVVNTLFQEAIRIGKRVRTVTGIDQHPVSVSYAAVELVKQTFGDLRGCTVLIIGAGEMGELTLKHLVAQGVSTILVSNRSFERAEALARVYGGEAIRYDLLFSQLERADIIIGCTAAPHFVITAGQVRQAVAARRGRPLFFLDIAVPRDIDPSVGKIPGVVLYDIDDLEHVVLEHMDERKKAAAAAEEMIKEAVGEFLRWLSSLSVVPTIKALRAKGEAIKEAELKRYLNRLGKLDARSEKLIRALAHSLMNKFLHTPIVRLKEYAGTHEGHLYSQVLENLFDLEVECDESGTFSPEVQSCEV
ncbi:MAG: glutamyl-tRNA reductase [Firmicutes bacterium]|nr:glutamyl-tRNA reductase [Bacillota bacterium]